MKANGLMFVRHCGGKTILCAIIDESEQLQGEAQHVFKGTVENGILSIKTTGDIVDIKELSIGKTPNGILTEPIWRT